MMRSRSHRNAPSVSLRRCVFLSVFLTTYIFLFIACVPQAYSWSGEPAKLTILYINDPHAHYLPYPEKDISGLVGGFAKVATVMEQERTRARSEGRFTLTLMGGDLLLGTPFSTTFKGELGAILMNQLKFTAMVVGNHEFEYGLNNLLSNLRARLDFPLLSANVQTIEGEYIFDRTLHGKIPSSKAGFTIIGLTTQQTPKITLPDNVKGLVVKDPINTAKECIQGLPSNDLVIALTHLGVDEDRKLAEACPRIGVIIGGHSHTALFKPLKVHNTIICQAGCYSRYVGELNIEVENGKVVNYDGKLISPGPDVKEDPGISATICKFKERLDPRLNAVIGRTEVALGSSHRSRSGQATALGPLIAYTMATNQEAQAGLVNAGTIRDSLPWGDVTLSDLYTALPFTDTVVRMDLTGKDIRNALERSLRLPEGSGGKLQTFGIVKCVNSAHEVIISRIGDSDFAPDGVYTVAISNFLATGGDGYSVFKENGRNIQTSGVLITELITNFFKEKRIITKSLLKNLNISLVDQAY
ncbi:MAG: 5'-nucleotidase C-terminal domain-containing protein [Deltaproteobacteria bacterium]|nr:5'-nucleotidase C-terminal domain-containing protein [Deltaproteobacteria bacterium]